MVDTRMVRLGPLGWKAAYERQLTPADANLRIARVAGHYGGRVQCLTDGDLASEGESIETPLLAACGELTVGDWVLLESDVPRGVRRLERESLLVRRAAGTQVSRQLIAANLDTLLIVSSCDDDFSLSRLERYLSLAAEAELTPVVVLTKADRCDDPLPLRRQAEALQSGLVVELLDAREPDQLDVLSPWCRAGQTVGIVGSSGVGKSTMALGLGVAGLRTQPVRESDSKGRHTTTARSLHRLRSGGVLIDTPGMRELQLAACEAGIASVFADVEQLARECRFRNCAHQGEPGCAVQQAVHDGQLAQRRLVNYRKLLAEQARNGRALHELRREERRLGKFYKKHLAVKQLRRRPGSDRA